MKKMWLFLIFSLLGNNLYAKDKEPIKSIDVYITPYYSAQNGKAEVVNTYELINHLLLSNKLDDFKKAVQLVEAAPDNVTPMTLMVLAARAYDVGLRDEAVFWFYNGKNRYITLVDVIDIKDKMFFETRTTMGAFINLIGSFINSYAFCDINKQREIQQKSINWVREHPYQIIFSKELPSPHTDRQAALKKAEKELDDILKDQDAYFANPKNLAEFQAKRKANNADQQFCW
ncbi:hypothetical protein [Pasteurella testudinis]|uniref:hypothetical protein n=1 Tax=Pasteurella testudinis TaxID=761 RepID=UPI0040596898